MPFDVAGARKAGYTDAEIADALAKSSGFDIAGARAARYSDSEIIAKLASSAAPSAAAKIPGAGPAVTPPAPPSMAQRAAGAGEAALATITAPLAYLNGLAGGGNVFVKRLLAEATGQPNPGQFDPGKAYDEASQAAQYVPRTETGKEYAGAVADAAQGLPALAGLSGEMAALGQAVRAARTGAPAAATARAAVEGTARDIAGPAAAAATSAAIDGTANAARAVQRSATTLPRRAWSAISRDEQAPTPGTMGSAGAAATDAARQRVATAESVGLTGDSGLTLGQATRDPAQLKFEVDAAGKNMELGGAIRERRIAQNEALLNTIERDIDVTGAQAPTLRAVGESVDQALVKQHRSDKAGVDALYRKARNSPEASALVDQAAPVTIGEGDRALTSTPLDYINSKPAGIKSTALVDAARAYAEKLGIAEMQDGKLVPRQATIQQMEQWRSEISGAIDMSKAPDRLHGTLLKGLIDAQTEPAAGPIFRQARAARTRLAQNYEDRAAVAKLLTRKPGTQDRAVALEDVFDHSIMKGSLDDVRNVRRVLHRSGEDGQQAWRELQGQTLKMIRDQATQSATTDSAGRRVISPAALDRTIRGLDHEGKLDFIFGKRGAQRLRDINEIAAVAKTVPPEAAVNFSNTATTLLAASGDLAASLATGVPAPLFTAAKLSVKHIKDAKTKKRIAEALRGLQSTNTQP